MKIENRKSKPWNISQGGMWNSVMDSHSLFIKSARSIRWGVYPMNRVYHVRNKSGDTTPKNSNICNISFLKRFIRMINQRVDRTHLDPSHHVLPSSVICTANTPYGEIYVRIVHWYFKNHSWDNMISMIKEIIICITVTLGHLLVCSTLHPIKWWLVVHLVVCV